LHVSPVFAYTSAAAGNLVRTGYSAAILAGCSAAMLVLASWNIRSSFEAGEETRAPDRASDAVPRTAARRRNLLQMNPMFSLVMRQTHRGQMLWFGALAVLAGIVWRLVVESSGKGSRNMSIVILGSYGINVLFKFFLAVESSRRFSQDRRTGALELLLTTPLPVPFILRGQQLALRRSFFPAIAGVAGMFLFWMLDGEILREVFVMLPCSLLLLAYDAETIRWLGMLNGLRTQRLPAAIMRTMGQVVGFPAAIFALVMFTSRGMGKYEAQAFIFLWTLGCVVYNVILIRAAMHKLGHLRSLAAGDKWRPAWVAGGLPSGRAAMPN
jgi:hypothetical protein